MRKTLRRLRRYPRALLGATLAVAVAGVITVAAWPHQHTTVPVYTPQIRARVYSSFTACLLTGPDGVTDTNTSPVWAGMQAASNSTHAQVSYLAMQGTQTATNAEAYINTLALRGCSVIVTSGTVPGQGAEARAEALPRTRFITVGAPATKSANIYRVTAATAAIVTREVAALLTSAVRTSSTAR